MPTDLGPVTIQQFSTQKCASFPNHPLRSVPQKGDTTVNSQGPQTEKIALVKNREAKTSMTTNEEYLKLQEHLSTLTSYGRHYAGILADTATLLYREFLGEIELSREEREDLLNILTNTAKKHKELIERSINERQKYIDTKRGKKEGSDSQI
jgi:hypothetical protein